MTSSQLIATGLDSIREGIAIMVREAIERERLLANEEIVTSDEMAQEIGVSAATVARWCREGQIDCLPRAGRTWRFTRAAFARRRNQ